MAGEIVVGVPGLWKDRSDLITSLAGANAGLKSPKYLAAGAVLFDAEAKKGFGFEVYDRDPSMRQAFEAAGQGRFPPALLDAIDRHTFTVYIVCKEEGRDAALRLLQATAFLLDAGGLAAKVESSGVASPPDRWRYLAGSKSILSLYEAYSVLVGGREYSYSCGMRTFGLPDVSVTSRVSAKHAPDVLTAFNHWQLLENPEPKDGDLFSTGASEPVFRLHHEEYGYEAENLKNNPYGRWHLELTDVKKALPAELDSGGEPLFMAMKSDDPKVVETVKRARATVGHFLRHYSCRHEYGVMLFKIYLPAEKAYLWLSLEEVRDGRLSGRVFEVPPEFKNLKVGQIVDVEVGTIFDWAIRKSGTLIGGFSMRHSREMLKPALRKSWDHYTGNVSFAPLEEIEP